MTTENSPASTLGRPQKKPRLWPAWIVLALVVAAFVVSISPSIANGARFGFMMLGPLTGAVLLLCWVFAFSRLRWFERLLIPLMTIVLGIGAVFLSTSTLGVTLWIYGVPLSIAAIVIGGTVSRAWTSGGRLALIGGLLVLVWGWFPLVRNDGFRGDYLPEITWRWRPTSESKLAPVKLVSDNPAEATELEGASWVVAETDWPNFRGKDLKSQAVGVTEPLNWETAPPKILWKQAIGPGWSSFCEVAGRLYTQEQRGDQELVTCYDAKSGEVTWQSGNAQRFSDVVAGAGPRATPTFDGGRLFVFGAKAMLSCLDAATGQLLWKRDLLKEVDAQVPVWGFSGSPIVVGDSVIVYAGGKAPNGLMAFDRRDGKTKWTIAASGMNFSSAQPMTFAEQTQVIFGTAEGLVSVEPESGAVLWKYRPQDWNGPAICQPQQIDELSLIAVLGDGKGVGRVQVEKEGQNWKVSDAWTSNQLKPSFNDFVVHKGYCYGFDQNIFACIDASSGKRMWKKGRYGFGQVVLLPEIDQLIVLGEMGDCTLVAADPKAHREVGKITPIQGKTWNHPIVASGRLYVRNGEEIAALDLTK